MGEFGNNLDVFNNIICYLESFNGEFPIKYFGGIKKNMCNHLIEIFPLNDLWEINKLWT